jgi:hypothetical protein
VRPITLRAEPIPLFISRLQDKKVVLFTKTADRETERQRDRETERQRDRETERQRDRETERQRDRETERQREHFKKFSSRILPLVAWSMYVVVSLQRLENEGPEQGCQIFLDTIYQNGRKYTKLPQH